MKKAINTEGVEVEVPSNTPTRAINGKYYLLDEEYKEELELQLAEWKAGENDRLWTAIRLKRDKLITETDWTQLSDISLSPELKESYRTYRQTLRDLPNTYSDPRDVVFPEKP